MHELMVTESILEIALRHARKADAGCVTDLYLVIGDLSSVVDDSVQFYWDFVSEGTVAEGAKLHFRRVPAELVCQDCGCTFGTEDDLVCPGCRSNNIRINAGQEFMLEAIEISNDASKSKASS